MRRARSIVVAAALVVPALAAGGSLSALEGANGWYTWQVAAAADAPAWCCFDWHRNTRIPGPCNLDQDGAYGSCDSPAPPGAQVRIYAQLEAGEPRKLRVLSPACAVEAAEGVTDLGAVEVAESFDWMRSRVAIDSRVSDEALLAIAMHAGERPLRWLVDAANGGAEGEIREQAIFWLGQVRISESADVIEHLMFSAEPAGIRQHAAFVLSQSDAPRRINVLIRQGRRDPDGETRAQAWFWLAQTGASRGEEAILQAIATDRQQSVREEAVFALSQLPEDRAVDALLTVLHDERLHHDVREKALFWLAHSESERGLAAIERLLAGGDAARH